MRALANFEAMHAPTALPSKGEPTCTELTKPLGANVTTTEVVTASVSGCLHAAIASLGYALHPLPALVKSGELFDPEGFRFCFRIAAFGWDDLSLEMREVLCGLVGIEPLDAQRRMAQEGFVIDMFGFGRAGRG